MALTYTAQDAIDYATQQIKSMPLDRVDLTIVRDISNMMWMEAPWRWTVGNFPNVTVLGNTQDYTVTVPSDFQYIFDSYVSDGTSNRILHIEPILPTTEVIQGNFDSIALTGTGVSGVLRLYPKPGLQPTPAWSIISLYKKTAPQFVSRAVLSTAGYLQIPDEWSWVFQHGVFWKALEYADDDRAGSATVDPMGGKAQYSGQQGVFRAALEYMKLREKLPTLKARMVPTQSMVT